MGPAVAVEPMTATRTRLGYGPDANQFVEVSTPHGPGPHPVVVLVHGGFWRAPYDLGLMRGLEADVLARGWAAWNIEYRRVGQPGGGYPGTLVDVAAAIDLLAQSGAEHRLNLRRVALVGHSAGGHLALWAAGRDRLAMGEPGAGPAVLPAVVVGLAPVSDLLATFHDRLDDDAVADFLGGPPDKVADAYRIAQPALDTGTAVNIHGDQDDRVPLEYSLTVKDRVPLIVVPGDDHFDVIDAASKSWAAAVGVLTAALVLGTDEPD